VLGYCQYEHGIKEMFAFIAKHKDCTKLEKLQKFYLAVAKLTNDPHECSQYESEHYYVAADDLEIELEEVNPNWKEDLNA
jgi:hypothetical protein